MKSMTPQEEVHARHILVETEDEAKAIAEQIKGGADFAKLAKEKSKDPGAAQGGDLGYFGKEQMVPEFAEVAFKMYPGQVSNPVKTQFGWHIIKVEDKRQRRSRDSSRCKRPDRDVPDPQGADRVCRQAARRAPRSSASTSRPTHAPDAKPEVKAEEPKKRCRHRHAGRAKREPESKTTSAGRPIGCSIPNEFGVMDSGPGASRRPGMTPQPSHDHRHLPARARTVSRHAADCRRAARDRRAGIRYAGRTDVLLVLFDPRHHSCRRVHALEMPLRAGRLVPRPSQGRQRPRAGGQFRQRQRLHRQIGAGRRQSSPLRSPPRRSAASPRKCSWPRPA